MRSPARILLRTLALAALAATALPAAAEEGAPPPADAASCRVPGEGEPAAASPRADLAPIWSRLAAEARQAGDDGIRPLGTRGYNYDAGRQDPAALGYEVRGR